MRIGLAVLLIAAHGLAHAQTVNKCVGKGGAATYQSEPCPSTQKAVKSWDATPEPPPSNDELWRRYRQRRKAEADSRYLSRLAGTDGSRSTGATVYTTNQVSACEAARQRRESVLRSANNDVSYDVRRHLNDAVFDACK